MKATEKTIRQSLELIKSRLAVTGLLRDWNESTVERLERGKTRITWVSSSTRPELMANAVSNISEYLMFLEGRHYQYQLIDGSLIQLSYDINSKNKIVQSRLVWYPCPVEFEIEELEYATISELIATTPTPKLCCRAPLRFDFAPHQAAENHSSTHLHIGSEDFRLPVQRALEPSRFIRLIVRTAYPQYWLDHAVFREAEDWSAEDLLNEDDKTIGALMSHRVSIRS